MRRGGRRRGDTPERLIGRRLWRERLLAGVSRETLGDGLGVSAEAIRQYECGEDRISPAELALAAGRLGVPLSRFCAVADEAEAAAPQPPAEMAEIRRLAAPRPLTLLSTPAFAQVRPLLAIWREARGELTAEAQRAVRASGLAHRMVLVRNPARSSRLITQYFGAGIRTMRPCESLLTIEQDFYVHHPDRDYAAWVADAYAETLWRRRPHFGSTRALIRMGATATLSGRYDRLVIPWRSDNNDCFAMALSIQRAAPVLSS
jgi:transcriptional regulator with XRE-family HTH domain